MAITTYTELTQAVGNWLERDDLSLRIPEFIALAEARLWRILRTSDLLTTADLSISSTSTALPSGLLEIKRIYLDTNPKTVLELVSPEILYESHGSTTSGKPVMYAIEGNNIIVGPTPDATYTAKLAYYAKPTALSDANATNNVLDNAPDVYLYAALLEAEPYLMNDERLQLWATALTRAIEDYQGADTRKEWSGSPIRIRPSVVY